MEFSRTVEIFVGFYRSRGSVLFLLRRLLGFLFPHSENATKTTIRIGEPSLYRVIPAKEKIPTNKSLNNTFRRAARMIHTKCI